ncbi:bifunctional 2',3'-cyclic-nucleotide 2'-phosphodiesterase/3'-nucleotidase [Neiella marina]|uniref:Bifunctional 2',3'-cyclic-nucleotide 2'-phosphodiesterase/3'-nucleotidase n=1 Tax=Neiella holothuriorum TaxID=2870530 RepID=A0ABS7EDK6_9GAMM|nr:bifunctional 2',3'-cyclic-nucleotide 2'-phosphodiesterase/3'-nucleotidase [Neiella holothuriorum]MBW8189772.1 bifunctional 2',3'-cyclic-nucleotide 2'-phosphodiesterase/3'-nucleotidase [Neiella holothuriorum]
MAHFRRSIFLLLAASLLSPVGSADEPVSIELRILETTDIHMHLVDYDYYRDEPSVSIGFSRVASLIHQARDEVVNSVLVDNGDLIQGAPLGDYVAYENGLPESTIHPVYRIMNQLGYTVANLGNHEFNFGLPFLQQSLAGANFPYVSANVYRDDGDDDPSNNQHYIDPYIIVTTELMASDGNAYPVNIGYIGFTPPQITFWDMDHLQGKIIAKDIVETARQLVPEMKAKGADIVVAIPHSGLYDTPRKGMDENATYHLAQVAGIDAILFGHSHRVFPGDPEIAAYPGVDNQAGTVFGVPAVMPGFWGSHLGLVDLTLQQQNGRWQRVAGHTSVRAIAERVDGRFQPLVEADASINKLVQPEHQATLNYMRQKVGQTSVRIHSYFALAADDPSVQLVNNAQRWYAQRAIRATEFDGLPVLSAAAPFKSGGRAGPDYYTDIAVGDVALIHLKDLYVYPNDLKVVKLNGAEVLDWLERSAGQFYQIDPQQSAPQQLVNRAFPSYNFDVIDGIEYEIDITQPSRYDVEGALINPSANRIVNARFNGKPLDHTQWFLVVTNNYRAGGGGQFPNMDGSRTVIHAPDKNRAVVAQYLASAQFDASIDQNWQFANNLGKANVIFQTSPVAKALAPKNLLPVAHASGAQAEFRLQP